MSRKGRFIAFDFGATSGRAVVGDVSESAFSLREIHRFPNNPVTLRGHEYWDFPALYRELLTGLSVYRQEYGATSDGIGVDTWGCDFGQLDRNGDLVRLPRHYRDSRTEGTPGIIDREFGNLALYQRNGIQFLVFNTLNQLVAMRRAGDPAMEITSTLLFMPDLFHYFLTGQKVSEFTLASISQLYNVNDGAWDKEVCRRFDFPPSLFPGIVHPGTVLGELQPGVTQETGVSAPVILPATHDTASAAVAVPSDAGRMAFISSGTWSIVGLEIEGPVLNNESFRMNVSNSGGAFGKTLYLKNVMGLWIIQQCREAWRREGRHATFDEIVRAAGDAVDPAVFIDPDDNRFLNPRDMVTEVLGAHESAGGKEISRHDIGTIGRVVFESLALKYRYTIEKLMRASGAEVEAIYTVGGGAANSLLNQLTSNATDLPVLTGPTEATAIGNITVQAIGAGLFSSLSEARSVIRRAFPVQKFQPAAAGSWNLKYARFLETTGLLAVR
jgi:rhamnulokinase